jgi:hypothetical protein
MSELHEELLAIADRLVGDKKSPIERAWDQG